MTFGRSLPGPSDVVDRYEVVAQLAQGGMAAVLVVRRVGAPGFDKLLAMKVMLPHLVSERKYVDMFLDEARIAARIQHRNVVSLFDVGEHDGLPHMVMELLHGQSLSRIQKKLAKERRWIDLGSSTVILAQAADGLHAAHETRSATGEELGVVHRDVSPQNVHVGYDGVVKVLDFGIAAARGRITSTASGELKGKFSYLAPEQISRTSAVDRRVDVWALGVVAWEQLARRRLFAAKDEGAVLWDVLNAPVEPLHTLVPELPRAVSECVMACLERSPHDRPSSCAEVAEVLWKASESIPEANVRSLGQWIAREFASDRLLEEERLAAALRRGPPPPIKEPEGSSRAPLEPAPIPARPARTSWKVWASAGVALAVTAGIASGAWLASGERAGAEPDAASTLEERSAPRVERPPEPALDPVASDPVADDPADDDPAAVDPAAVDPADVDPAAAAEVEAVEPPATPIRPPVAREAEPAPPPRARTPRAHTSPPAPTKRRADPALLSNPY